MAFVILILLGIVVLLHRGTCAATYKYNASVARIQVLLMITTYETNKFYHIALYCTCT